jgi:putative ABC transport system permease protein
VIKTGRVLTSSESGKLSLGISQITPLNIFIGLSDLKGRIDNFPGINRLLFEKRSGITVSDIYNSLHKVIGPGDIGLTVRKIPATGGYELVSGRIFIDDLIAGEIEKLPVESHPAITYLANSISLADRSAPYSFVSALDPDLYPGIPAGNGIILSRWIAEDLKALPGDTVTMTYFTPDSRNRLVEAKNDFIVSEIVEMTGIWSDSLLMPEFPGIAGKESCSAWDAGISINMDLIRNKDEEYWNLFRGTPKAFINYEKGKELWGSNYGPVTSLRFGKGVSDSLILAKATGALDPYKSGFTITDLPEVSSDAAGSGVDFSSLFLGLGFFIILSAIILLILVVSTFLESKRKQISTLYSIGFRNNNIRKILLIETALIALGGALPGALAGSLFNIIVVKALNSVWQGAVQTDTLSSGFYPGTLLTGFGISVLLIFLILMFRSSGFMKQLNRKESGAIREPSSKQNFLAVVVFSIITVIVAALSFLMPEQSTLLSFCAGIGAFTAMILMVRQSYIGKKISVFPGFRNAHQISGRYYSFNPQQAIAPVLFLAAGLFAVIITGVNRMNINDSMLKRSGGTGGFLLWGEFN